MDHGWMIDVIDDLREYAGRQGLFCVYDDLGQLITALQDKLTDVDAKVEACGQYKRENRNTSRKSGAYYDA